MLEFIFTLDYEIHGDGSGKLRDCVIRPTEEILKIFQKYRYPLVIFPDVLEFEKIEKYRSDPDIDQVKVQLEKILTTGNEVGLHVHSWWINAHLKNNGWEFDFNYANLCSLSKDHIKEIIENGLMILRRFLNDSRYQPVVFRNGFWIMQPTKDIVEVLKNCSIQIDSTLFKGGRIKGYNVDYRPSIRNGYFWRIFDDINKPHEEGLLWEVPIYTELVPFWKMLSRFLGNPIIKEGETAVKERRQKIMQKWNRMGDYFRLKYPRKLDYCFMNLHEILASLDKLILLDKKTESEYKPIVLVGHSKNLLDFKKVERIVQFIKQRDLKIVTFSQVLTKISSLILRDNRK
ncbi:MAG: hypothetical protein ACP5P6_10920 [Candidatus Saccharicenans sp.]